LREKKSGKAKKATKSCWEIRFPSGEGKTRAKATEAKTRFYHVSFFWATQKSMKSESFGFGRDARKWYNTIMTLI